MTYRLTDFCLCYRCGADLREAEGSLHCLSCHFHYEIRNGIPMFLPSDQDEERQQYVTSYQELATEDLRTPVEENREARHMALLQFIGNVRHMKVLDIGSSHALYLHRLDAGFKVAFDLAYPYLAAIPDTYGIVGICGDAECLPFKPGFFDVIIVSDILEHLLSPENLIARLRSICRRGTRLIVHVPWEEELEQYRESKYEFAHLRTFNAYRFAQLWQGYYVKRVRGTYPTLDEPLLFKLQGRIPRRLYNLLVFLYFESNVSEWEFSQRSRWVTELPKRERWLLWLYKPKFKIFELRSRKDSVYSVVYRLLRVVLAVRDRVRRSKTAPMSAEAAGSAER